MLSPGRDGGSGRNGCSAARWRCGSRPSDKHVAFAQVIETTAVAGISRESRADTELRIVHAIVHEPATIRAPRVVAVDPSERQDIEDAKADHTRRAEQDLRDLKADEALQRHRSTFRELIELFETGSGPCEDLSQRLPDALDAFPNVRNRLEQLVESASSSGLARLLAV